MPCFAEQIRGHKGHAGSLRDLRQPGVGGASPSSTGQAMGGTVPTMGREGPRLIESRSLYQARVVLRLER